MVEVNSFMYKRAFKLVKTEIRMLFPAYILTFAVTVLLGLFSITFLKELINTLAGYQNHFNGVSVDILFVFLSPCLSIVFLSSPYLSLKTLKEDPFGKRIALFRTMPVPIKVLTKSRMLLMLITLLILSTTFYTTIVIGIRDIYHLVFTTQQLVSFLLFWFGFSLTIGGLNVYIESGTNGKMLYIFSFLYSLTIVSFIIVFNLNTKNSVVEKVAEWTQQYDWMPSVVMIIIGLLSYNIWGIILQKRLSKRDYL